jgi:hypothetical protein
VLDLSVNEVIDGDIARNTPSNVHVVNLSFLEVAGNPQFPGIPDASSNGFQIKFVVPFAHDIEDQGNLVIHLVSC